VPWRQKGKSRSINHTEPGNVNDSSFTVNNSHWICRVTHGTRGCSMVDARSSLLNNIQDIRVGRVTTGKSFTTDNHRLHNLGGEHRARSLVGHADRAASWGWWLGCRRCRWRQWSCFPSKTVRRGRQWKMRNFYHREALRKWDLSSTQTMRRGIETRCLANQLPSKHPAPAELNR